jgi:FkbM family methyltransferase
MLRLLPKRLIFFLCVLFAGKVCWHQLTIAISSKTIMPISDFPVSHNVQLVNLKQRSSNMFYCICTKALLDNIRTRICLHNKQRDIFISAAYRENLSIWEESHVKRMLQFLVRDKSLQLIDVGANIGTYTMYAAALGRFVLAIECFQPNIVRLRHSLQLDQLTERLVLVQNAIHDQSGQVVRLSINTKNIGGQHLLKWKNGSEWRKRMNMTSWKNPFLVKTIRFDELLPILVARSVRRAVVKIDVEGSESAVLRTGQLLFD